MANTRKYNKEVTVNLIATGVVSEGLLYGVDSSGNPVLADRTTGPQKATGFCVKGLSAADGAAGKAVALAREGIVECVAANIAGGAFTVGATVYLDTAGKYTTTKPSTAADILQAVGTALTTLKVAVHISPLTLTLQAAGTTTIAP